MATGSELDNRSVTFYIANDNSILEILKNSAQPIAIQEMNGLIWHRIRGPDATPRFERAPPYRNIADLPTRRAKIKYKSLKRGIPLDKRPKQTHQPYYRSGYKRPPNRTAFVEGGNGRFPVSAHNSEQAYLVYLKKALAIGKESKAKAVTDTRPSP